MSRSYCSQLLIVFPPRMQSMKCLSVDGWEAAPLLCDRGSQEGGCGCSGSQQEADRRGRAKQDVTLAFVWTRQFVIFVLKSARILVVPSRQEGVSAEFRGHTLPSFLPQEAGGGSSQTSVTRWVLYLLDRLFTYVRKMRWDQIDLYSSCGLQLPQEA